MTMFVAVCLMLVQGGIPYGSAKVQVDLGTATIDVFTYKPTSYRDGPMLMVFHGMLRNAEEYRDHARSMGDRFGMLVAAPCFDSKQFGQGKYQQGGLFRDGKVLPRAEWTWSLVPKLADQLRLQEGRPSTPYYLIGHSAGAQFLVRLTAFVPTEAKRIVVANPGSTLFPTNELPYPYGFGNLPASLNGDDSVRNYLARPLVLYLGTRDTERDEDLDKSEDADRQGRTRFERGHNAYRRAAELAKRKGWEFRWRLVEAPDVGHDHQAMFDAPSCREALFAGP
jgi:pimeloyl-ACP methyl ester carboxylesterase